MPFSGISDGDAVAARRRANPIDARLVGPGGDGLCRIQAIAGRTLSVRTVMLLGRADWVRVDLPNRQSASGQVEWAAHHHVGVTLAVPIVDIDQFLARCSADEIEPPALPPRAPRFLTNCPVVIWQGSTAFPATMLDVSDGGARFATAASALHPDHPLLLSIPGLPPLLAAECRWTAGGHVGVAFAQRLAFDTLAPWLDVPAQRFAGRATG
ncbi:PilZ domain-containing protein [Sphingomonas sp. M6A6_1c]